MYLFVMCVIMLVLTTHSNLLLSTWTSAERCWYFEDGAVLPTSYCGMTKLLPYLFLGCYFKPMVLNA